MHPPNQCIAALVWMNSTNLACYSKPQQFLQQKKRWFSGLKESTSHTHRTAPCDAQPMRLQLETKTQCSVDTNRNTTSNKGIATSNRGIATSSKKLLVAMNTSSSLCRTILFHQRPTEPVESIVKQLKVWCILLYKSFVNGASSGTLSHNGL